MLGSGGGGGGVFLEDDVPFVAGPPEPTRPPSRAGAWRQAWPDGWRVPTMAVIVALIGAGVYFAYASQRIGGSGSGSTPGERAAGSNAIAAMVDDLGGGASVEPVAASTTARSEQAGPTSGPAVSSGTGTAGTASTRSAAPTTTGPPAASQATTTTTGPVPVTPQRNPGDPPRIANPGHLFSVAGQPVSYQVVVASAEGDTLAFSATGLPDGLRIDRGTGEIAGTPTRVQTASVAVTVSGASGSFTQGFTWDIRPASPS